jgi:hypothetical protein
MGFPADPGGMLQVRSGRREPAYASRHRPGAELWHTLDLLRPAAFVLIIIGKNRRDPRL